MNIGMLWFDNDPKANLDTKIERAALYYAKKYGKNPTLCFVHPSMLETSQPAQQKQNLDGFEVRSSKKILPNHLWLGINVHSTTSMR